MKPAVLCEKGGSGNNRCARLHSGEAAERDFFAPSFCLGATRPETENEAVACSDAESWVSLAVASRKAVTVESKLDQLGIKRYLPSVFTAHCRQLDASLSRCMCQLSYKASCNIYGKDTKNNHRRGEEAGDQLGFGVSRPFPASVQAEDGVLQEDRELAGHQVQVTGVGIFEQIGVLDKVMLEEVLAYTLVQLLYQPQKGFGEAAPILGAWVFFTRPE